MFVLLWSELITGTMQTNLGIHQHRTMIKKVLSERVKTIPELFKNAGYLTFNEEKTDILNLYSLFHFVLPNVWAFIWSWLSLQFLSEFIYFQQETFIPNPF